MSFGNSLRNAARGAFVALAIASTVPAAGCTGKKPEPPAICGEREKASRDPESPYIKSHPAEYGVSMTEYQECKNDALKERDCYFIRLETRERIRRLPSLFRCDDNGKTQLVKPPKQDSTSFTLRHSGDFYTDPDDEEGSFPPLADLSDVARYTSGDCGEVMLESRERIRQNIANLKCNKQGKPYLVPTQL